MSDMIVNPEALDPDRPWIEDEEQLPSNMNWFDTFFNPTGQSPKLHFTRAWTVLFFAQFLAWFGLGFLIFILGVVGADTSAASAGRLYIVAGVFLVTSVLSVIIHLRRLNHAGKSPLWAIIVLIPLLLGMLSFIGAISGKATQYNELYEARETYLEDPAAWRENRLEERRKVQEEARKAQEEAERAKAEAEASGENAEGGEQAAQRPQRGGQRGPGGFNRGPSPENPLPDQTAFVLTPSLPMFYLPIMLLNSLVMIWSLLWVARREDRRSVNLGA